MVSDITWCVRLTVSQAADRSGVPAVWYLHRTFIYPMQLSGVSYGTAIHASVFVPPLVGFLGHVVREVLRTE